MKKLVCLLLALLMAFTLCFSFVGCDSADTRDEVVDDEDEEEDEESADTSDDETDSESASKDDSDKETSNKFDDNSDDEAVENPVENPVEDPEDEPTADKTEFSMGKVVGNTYRNTFLGLECTLPSDWTFYSDEQILELNNIATGYLDEETLEQLQQVDIVYDMSASNAEGSNVTINLERHNEYIMTTLDLKSTLESQASTIVTAYENMGYTDIEVEYQKIKVDGVKFDALVLSAEIQGFDFEGVVFCFKKGNYLASVSVTTLGEGNVEKILDCFTVA